MRGDGEGEGEGESLETLPPKFRFSELRAPSVVTGSAFLLLPLFFEVLDLTVGRVSRAAVARSFPSIQNEFALPYAQDPHFLA